MAENIVGPFGTGVQETTVRPADPSPGSANDTWFEDCVNGDPSTGTRVPSVWLNKVCALFRNAIRGMGVPDAATDDDMLLDAIMRADKTLANVGTGTGIFKARIALVDELRTLKGAGGIALTLNGAGTEVTIDGSGIAGGGGSGVGLPPDLIVVDAKASGVDSGTFTAGSRQQRTLNTLVRNTISASLAANRVTLPAGTYHGDWRCLARGVARHMSWLRNVSDSTDIMQSLPAFSEPFSATPNPGTQDSRGYITPFTIAASKIVELQHQCTITRATDGFGSDTGFGSANWYAILRLWKTA